MQGESRLLTSMSLEPLSSKTFIYKENINEMKIYENKLRVKNDINKIKKATKLDNLETFILELKKLEEFNYKEMKTINELNNQVNDLETNLEFLGKEKEILMDAELRGVQGSRYIFLKKLKEEEEQLQIQNEGQTLIFNSLEQKLSAQLKEAHNIFYTIGCDNLINRTDLKNDFLVKENIHEILRIIENRMNEVLFVYHLIVSKVDSTAKYNNQR